MSNESDDPDPNAEDARAERLVAYLDGEMDDESSRRIEAELASDAGLRQQLGALEQTWEALDELDRCEVDERFTQTTLEMVALAAEEDVERVVKESPRRSRRRWLLGGIGLAAAAVAGFTAALLLWPNPNRQLLKDLPVLEHFEHYRLIDDVDFLKELQQQELFPEKTDGQ